NMASRVIEGGGIGRPLEKRPRSAFEPGLAVWAGGAGILPAAVRPAVGSSAGTWRKAFRQRQPRIGCSYVPHPVSALTSCLEVGTLNGLQRHLLVHAEDLIFQLIDQMSQQLRFPPIEAVPRDTGVVVHAPPSRSSVGRSSRLPESVEG